MIFIECEIKKPTTSANCKFPSEIDPRSTWTTTRLESTRIPHLKCCNCEGRIINKPIEILTLIMNEKQTDDPFGPSRATVTISKSLDGNGTLYLKIIDH